MELRKTDKSSGIIISVTSQDSMDITLDKILSGDWDTVGPWVTLEVVTRDRRIRIRVPYYLALSISGAIKIPEDLLILLFGAIKKEEIISVSVIGDLTKELKIGDKVVTIEEFTDAILRRLIEVQETYQND